MHEMGLANSILEAVQKELPLYPGYRAAKAGVRIGAFDESGKGDELGPGQIELEEFCACSGST